MKVLGAAAMSSRYEALQRLTQLAVQRLVDDWSSRSYRPWGMWVLLWSAIESDEELETLSPRVPLIAAWFLTDSGFNRRDGWSYFRYLAAQQMEFEQRWFNREPGVGVLEVAPYRDRIAVYSAGHLAERNAYGLRTEFDAWGQPVAHRLWMA